jgi:hypothetical protein
VATWTALFRPVRLPPSVVLGAGRPPCAPSSGKRWAPAPRGGDRSKHRRWSAGGCCRALCPSKAMRRKPAGEHQDTQARHAAGVIKKKRGGGGSTKAKCPNVLQQKGKADICNFQRKTVFTHCNQFLSDATCPGKRIDTSITPAFGYAEKGRVQACRARTAGSAGRRHRQNRPGSPSGERMAPACLTTGLVQAVPCSSVN